MTLSQLDQLLPPPGFEVLQDLGSRSGLRVLHATKDGVEVLLRLAADGEGLDEGQAELAVLAVVDHPGLARLVEHGRLPGGGSFVARHWVPGQDLLAWSRDRTPEEIATVVASVAVALDHLHRLGFVHADLKPENIIVDHDGDPVVCDHGLSRHLGSGDEDVQGTLYALAPEVLLGASPRAAADLFALGAMLHRLLVGRRASARTFYSRFPTSSFFDAAGSPPEELPEWARDVVASMVSRDPARRPSSAAAVARTLRARLGLDADLGREAEELRFPLDLGREAWLTGWHESLSTPPDPGEPRHQWIRLPRGEHAPAIAATLRLFASLRELATAGKSLDAELTPLTDSVRLDDWASRLSRGEDPVLFLSLQEPSSWSDRAVAHLVRALRQHKTKSPVRLVLVAHGSPPLGEGAAFEELDLPPVPGPRFQAFLQQHLLEEDPARRAAFGQLLLGLAGGAATMLDLLLRRTVGDGWLLPEGNQGWRLRPGPLPNSLSLAPDADRHADVDSLSESARDILAGLHVSGGRIDSLALFSHVSANTPAAVLQLTERRFATWEAGANGQELALTAPLGDPRSLGSTRLARHHARRAEALTDRGASALEVLPHRLGAGEDVESELECELERVLDRGAGEIALSVLDRAVRCARDRGLDLDKSHARLSLARSRAWTTLGRLDEAERSLEHLDTPKRASEAGILALGRARIASNRRETDPALAFFDEALSLDPALAPEAQVGRVQLHHELGHDEQTIELVAEVRDDVAPRQRAFLNSLAAVSAFRLGRVEDAHKQLKALLELIRPWEDAVLEGAIRIDLATIERRTGSLSRAKEELQIVVDLYTQAGFAAGLAHAQATLGGVLREEGQMLAAEPLLVRAMEMRERLGSLRGANTVRGVYGLLLAERGHARGAVEELERSAARMEGAQLIRFVPLLLAKADEMRARLGIPPSEVEQPQEVSDPRVFVARARALWLRDDAAAARELAGRGLDLAKSLKLVAVEAEAELLLARLDGGDGATGRPTQGTLAAEDYDLLALCASAPGTLDGLAARVLAGSLEARGRDDRAARLWFAIAARLGDDKARQAGEACLQRLSAGLSAEEIEAFRYHLIGIPDPWPGDLTVPHDDEEDLDMEVVALLDINRRLVAQEDLTSLLGEIVDHALDVTGAERGFLILEEEGALRFDTAHDSRRGDIAAPDFEVSRSILDEALERMEPMRLSNAVDDPLLGHTPSVVSLELRSILCVPFRVDASMRGAIYVDHRLRTGAFGDKAERLCALLADQAALAIQHLRRVEEIKTLNHQLERKVVRQEGDLIAAKRALNVAGLRAADGGIVGSSNVMEDVRSMIDRAAKTGMVVLVGGPSGTGKELAARALHDNSPRSAGTFVSESCAALPPTLIESELFGYRRGAFTGADADREGLFERARGGTLFLDEIGEMPLELQSKLLRVLETGEVRRLGDPDARPVDFRLVVATNRDLVAEVAEKRFRQDLYYRIDGLRIDMPTLAARTEDIPELVEHFLRLEEAKDGLPRRASKSVLARLADRPWPGNVRELRNEVARMCVLSEGDLLDPDLIRRMDPSLNVTSHSTGEPSTLADVERKAILDAIEYSGGDKREAAKLLGISRAKIYQRLKEWSLREEGG